MTNDQMRLFKLEQALRLLQQQVSNLIAQVGNLMQQQYAPQPFGGGGGGNNFPYFCSPTGTVTAATGPPSTGTPGGPLASQQVYEISGGAFSSVATGVDLYNAMQSSVVATKTCAVLQNQDGSYSVISQSCT
jgi:hypothetical protein